MRPVLSIILLAALLAGCGSSDEGDPIPSAQAEQLQQRLTVVENQLEGGATCDNFDETFSIISSDIDGLSSGVDSELRDALQQSFDHLKELVDGECDADQPQTDTTETTPPETTETVPPPTTETTPPETTPETAPDQQPGRGNGNGNGNGRGNSGGGSNPGAGVGGGLGADE